MVRGGVQNLSIGSVNIDPNDSYITGNGAIITPRYGFAVVLCFPFDENGFTVSKDQTSV